ncbi:putative enoyl-CoA hydratase echA6, partial [Dissostichus eleginoides]
MRHNAARDGASCRINLKLYPKPSERSPGGQKVKSTTPDPRESGSGEELCPERAGLYGQFWEGEQCIELKLAGAERRHATHMNTSPTHGPVPPINQHSARADYTLPLRSRAGFGGILGRLG